MDRNIASSVKADNHIRRHRCPGRSQTQLGHFSESEIDHFVMAITSADYDMRHDSVCRELAVGRSQLEDERESRE